MKKPRFFPFFTLLFFFCFSFSSADVSTAERDVLRPGGRGDSGGGCVRGSGNSSTTRRAVSFFDSINVDGPVDVFVSAGLRELSVEVSGDNNLHSHLITETRGKTLYLSQRGAVCPKKGLKVSVFTDTIRTIDAAGTSTVKVSGLTNSHLLVRIKGSVDLRGIGETEKLVVEARGAADLNLRALKARFVTISATGSSDAVVYASNVLYAKVEGAGDVTYYGNPPVVFKKISGAGDLTKGKELTGTD